MDYCIGVAAVGMQVSGGAALHVRARCVAIATVLCLLNQNQIRESIVGWGIIETPFQIVIAHLQQVPHCTF